MKRRLAINTNAGLVGVCLFGFAFVFINLESMAEEPRARSASPKGVVLVMIDDIGYGDVNALSPSNLRTPNLDRLSRQSLRLTDFHVGTTCSPTRASLMTGRYVNITGVWHTIAGRSMLRANEQTMADVFKANGWATGVFGKWHLGEGYPFAPRFRGFETTVIHGGGGVGQQPDYWGNNYYASRNSTTDFDGNPTGNDFYLHNGTIREADEFCTDYFFTHAFQFMKQALKNDKPFFCYIPTNAAHGPFNAPVGGKQGFDGLVENIDENMGRLDTFLETEGIRDEVLVIFMSDNGTAGNERMGGLRGKKGTHYEGGHRVPFFIRWKQGNIGGDEKTAREVDSLSAVADLLPTFVDLFELERPGGGLPIHGISLKDQLLDEKRLPTSRTWIVDTQRTGDLIKWKNLAVMRDEVIDGRLQHKWRLTRQNKETEFELYDVLTDRGQAENLIANHRELAEKLVAEYENWWREIDSQTRDYPPSVIGVEPESILYSHDWIHQGSSPWHQNHIKRGATGTRTSSVRFEKDGTYQIELRRWPREDGGAMDGTDSTGEGEALPVAAAQLTIDGVGEWNAKVPAGSSSSVFTVDVNAGEATTLRTALLNDQDEILAGAYYVYIRHVGE